MTVQQAAEQLLEIVEKKNKQSKENNALSPDSVCVGLARVGGEDQSIVAATLRQLATVDMGGPLHSLIIPGNMHPLEMDMLRLFALDDTVKASLTS
nr:hypothetical protein BaRGS_034989 [Batillaria attramentaria]